MRCNFSHVACLLLVWFGAVGGLRAQTLPGPRAVTLNLGQIRQQLNPATAAPRANHPAGPPVYRLVLPTLSGPQAFLLTETFVLPAADAAAQRRLRTFVGVADNAPEQRVSLVLTPEQLTAQLQTGSQTTSLRPAPGPNGGGSGYVLRPEPPTTGPCNNPSSGLLLRPNKAVLPAPFSFGTEIRRIRMAIIVTQEYYAKNGNTDAAVELAVVTAINQMTDLYLSELAESFELAKPTGGNYYFSAVTTPTLAQDADAVAGRLRYQKLFDVDEVLNSRFASSDYDLGHCFHDSGGGVAYRSVICDEDFKARGWSAVNGNGFQHVLAHEMGHQHGAAHTWSGSCPNKTFVLGSNLEPGGGATIMAYAISCGYQNLLDLGGGQAYHFNLLSLDQMRDYLGTVTCPTKTANPNRPPTISAGPGFTIPRNTPFTLTATGSDPDGETVYYTWDQYDYTTNIGALGSIAGTSGVAAINDPDAPLFRPRPPRTDNSRTFPDLRYVLANRNQPADNVGEALPNVGRQLNFVVTARDKRATGGTFSTDNVTLTVAPDTGPFQVTTQNESPTLWVAGQNATVTWAVNGTNQAPISVSQVRITLSTDGGQSFGQVLAAAVPNSGSASVRVPNVATSRARVRVEAVGNIFFDINDTDFPVGNCPPVASQLLPATDLTAAAGSGALLLSENGFSLTELTGTAQLRGSITASDPTNFTTFTTRGCTTYLNRAPTHYDAYQFAPSTTGTYTIGTPTGFDNMLLRLYSPAGFSATDPCRNRLADNTLAIGGLLPRSITASLTAGQTYTLVVSNSGGVPSGTTDYSISFTSAAAGGSAYAPLALFGYDYHYVVVNTATDQVVGLAPTADLRQLPDGTYNVYGLLFQRGARVSDFLNGSLSALSTALGSGSFCGQLSVNVRAVTITGSTLPATLTEFTARRVGAATELAWRTAMESNMAYFEVERSLDGQTFVSLGQVAATNTTSTHDYSFSDYTAGFGLSYYRLLLRELDGKQAYSAVVAVNVITGLGSATYSTALRGEAYPNPVPAGARLQLKLHLATAQPAELRVTDGLGRLLLRRPLALAAGTTQLNLPEATQWHGLCLVQVRTTNGQHWQQKVALQ